MSNSNSPKRSDDLISNVLDIVHEEILKVLPIQDAARTSVLSKQWRSNWLSLKRLVFDDEFFIEGRECTDIISSILLHHNGPVHEFILYIPEGSIEDCINFSPWLSFLSKNRVRWIKICCGTDFMPISSHIFWCSELIHLDLDNMTLHPPPSGFSGFPKLKRLLLRSILFSREYILPSLMAKCRKLVTLSILHCVGMSNIVINLPSLESLTIAGDLKCDSIAFRNVCNLKSVMVLLYGTRGKWTTIKKVDSFNNLASSSQLQCITFGGGFCEFLAAASIKKLVPVTFNHVNRLALTDLALSSLGTLQNIFDMVESCPSLTELVIYVRQPKVHSGEYANNYELGSAKINDYKSLHLVNVRVMSIIGSDFEIQLIEYLLTIAVKLRSLIYQSHDGDADKLSIVREIPKASPNVLLICML